MGSSCSSSHENNIIHGKFSHEKETKAIHSLQDGIKKNITLERFNQIYTTERYNGLNVVFCTEDLGSYENVVWIKLSRIDFWILVYQSAKNY